MSASTEPLGVLTQDGVVPASKIESHYGSAGADTWGGSSDWNVGGSTDWN